MRQERIENRLFRSIVPGVLFILLTVEVLLDVLVVERLEDNFDELLTAKSQGVIALSELEADGIVVEQYNLALPQLSSSGEVSQELGSVRRYLVIRPSGLKNISELMSLIRGISLMPSKWASPKTTVLCAWVSP